MKLREGIEKNPYNFKIEDGYNYGKNNIYGVKTDKNEPICPTYNHHGLMLFINGNKKYLDGEILEITKEDIILKTPQIKEDYFKIPEFRERLKRIGTYYGSKAQVIKSIEEMAELTKALAKIFNSEEKIMFPNDEVLNEIADVYIMLGQLKMIFGISEVQIGHKIDEKLTRQIERIENEKKDQY